MEMIKLLEVEISSKLVRIPGFYTCHGFEKKEK